MSGWGSAGGAELVGLDQIMQLIPLPVAAAHGSGRQVGLQLTFAGLRQGAAQGTAAQLGRPAMKPMEGSRTGHEHLLLETPSV